MARLAPEVQLLALALLNYADDEGYFRADPVLVRAAVCPFIDSSMIVHGRIITLEKVGWIALRNNAEQGQIGFVTNFRKHQQIQRPKPSKLKTYFVDDSSLIGQCVVNDSSLLDQGSGIRDQGSGDGHAESSPSDADVGPRLDFGSSEPPAVSRKKTRGGGSRSPLVDAAHLEELKKIYRPDDVDSAWAKLRAWLLTPAGQGKSASKRRLGTFLRDAEPIGDSSDSGSDIETAAALAKKNEGPEGWQAAAEELWPGCRTSGGWLSMPDDVRVELRRHLKKSQSTQPHTPNENQN